MRGRIAALSMLVLVAAGLATRARVSADMADALPREGAAGAAFADAARFSLLDTTLFVVDGSEADEDALHAAIDRLGATLASRPYFRSVRYRFGIQDGAAVQDAARRSLAVLVDAEVLRERTSEVGIRAALSRAQLQLLGPAGSLAAAQLARDPLGLGDLVAQQVLRAGASPGIELRRGHLVSADGKHGLLYARASTPALGTSPGSALMQGVEADLAACALPADWIGSHRFAAEAQARIKREVNVAVTAGSTGIVLAFLVAFRSLRALAGTLPPLLVASATAGAAAGLCSPVHGIALAFGGALASLGVDYWIHLYVTGCAEGVPAAFGERLERGRRALRHLAPAYAISVLATAGAFGMLTTSAFPVVADLGWLGIGVAAGAIACTALAGPVAFAALARPGDAVPAIPLPGRVPGWLAGGVLAGVGTLGLVGTSVSFDGDPRAMDAREPETARLEAAVEAHFGGGGTTALLVAEGPGLDAALARLRLAVDALRPLPGLAIQDPLGQLPTAAEVAERARVATDPEISARFSRVAEELGFDAPSLLPGLAETLRATVPPTVETWRGTVAEDTTTRTIATGDGDGVTRVAAFVRGTTQEALDHARRELDLSGAEVRFVHPAGVAAEGAEQVRQELLSRAGAGLALVLLALFLRYRDVARVFAAAVPSLAAAAGTLGTLAMLGVALTPASGPALVLVLGIAYDQGIFLVEGGDPADPSFRAARAAIMVALATAFLGFTGLLLAEHPAVHGIGLVVTLGIAFTFVGAFAIVPALVTDAGRAATTRWAPRVALALVLGLQADALAGLAGWLPLPPVETSTSPGPVTDEAGARRLGKSSRARIGGTWLYHLFGTPYEIGRAVGTLGGEVLQRNEEAAERELRRHVPSLLGRYLLVRGTPLLVRTLADDIAPEWMEEMRGVADVGSDPFAWLAPRYTRKVALHTIHDLGQAMVDSPILACTGFAAGGDRSADGHWRLARNWDFDGGGFFDEEKAVVVIERNGGIPMMHVAIPGLTGSVSGVNAAGIAAAVFAAGSDAPIRPTTPMILAVREILDRATSIEDARAILDRRRGFVSENVLVVDGERGRAAVLEVTPDDVDAVEVDGFLAVANHLRGKHRDDSQNQWRMQEGTTVARLARMEELGRDGTIDLARAIAMLRDRAAVGGAALPPGHESAIDADIASHGVVIDATARTIAVSGYPNLAGAWTQFSLPGVVSGAMSGSAVAEPGDPDRALRSHEARALLRSGTESALEKALRLAPGNADVMLALGELRLRQGDRDRGLGLVLAASRTPLAHAEDQRRAEAILAAGGLP